MDETMDEREDIPREIANADVSEYNLSYRATTDTEWVSNPNSPNPKKGTIKKGETIYFNREPSPIGASWQDAKIPDGTIKFVRPYDFEKA